MSSTKSHESFTFTVGKLDAGMAILIGERAHLIEFPSLLLPPGVGSGSIVNIAVHRNTSEEQRQQSEFWELQEEIHQSFGLESPKNPQLELRNVTQTSVTLEWPALQLATARLRSLDIYKNGQRLATIPSPLQNTSTKLSGLELQTEYSFQLVLRTTAGTYPSNVIRVRTHTITDTSGISVCFGNIQDAVLLENAKMALRDMHAKWSDKIQIDTTHFVCTTPAAIPNGSQASTLSGAPGVEYQRALQLSIPVVQPHWILACHGEKKMVPIANYYLGATPSAPLSSAPFSRPQSLQNPPGPSSPTAPVPSNRTSLPPSSRSTSTSPISPKSHSSAFVNQTDVERDHETEDTLENPASPPKTRSRNGTMKKDFKFPNTPPSPVTPPPVPSLPTSVPQQPEAARDHENVGYDVAPQEVPPPPPVEKESVQSAIEDDAEDDVGPTVEVDLS